MVQGNVFVSSRIRVCMAPEERTLIDKDVFETRTFAWLPCRALREGGGGGIIKSTKKRKEGHPNSKDIVFVTLLSRKFNRHSAGSGHTLSETSAPYKEDV